MSMRISGVKNFESHTASLLRGLPFSQVQSAYAKGAVGAGFSGRPEGTCGEPMDALRDAGSTIFGSGGAAGAAGVGARVGAAGTAAAEDRPLSSTLSSSISACIAANCFAT